MSLPSLSNVASAISSGNFSSALATTTGGASSIATSLGGMIPSLPNVPSLPSVSGIPGLPSLSSVPSIPGLPSVDSLKTTNPPAAITGLSGLMDAAKGISKSAFTAISDSFKPLQAGVPQNLTAINLKNKLDQAASDTKSAAAPTVESLNSGLSAAGVDVATGKIPAVDAAIASGGVGAGLSALSGVMGNVPGMSSIASPSALASGISNLPGGQSAISSIVNSSSLTTTGVSDTLSGLGSITKNASSAALNQISSATSGSSSLSGLLSGGALTGAGSALNGALTNPSSLLNGAAGSIPNIPGLPSVSGLPSVDSLTKGLQSGKQSLSSLVSTGISPAAAAALTASMNSLSTSSPFPVKMPTVAEKTVDRSEVSSQINNLLGDKKVPSPNYSGTIAPAATGSYQSYDDRLLAVEKYSAERKVITDAQQALYDKARAAYDDASQTLPQGDPELHKLAQVAITEGKKLLAIKQETYDGRLAILTA